MSNFYVRESVVLELSLLLIYSLLFQETLLLVPYVAQPLNNATKRQYFPLRLDNKTIG